MRLVSKSRIFSALIRTMFILSMFILFVFYSTMVFYVGQQNIRNDILDGLENCGEHPYLIYRGGKLMGILYEIKIIDKKPQKALEKIQRGRYSK